jgi:O-antigen/teichoic acid export membrane protein
MATPLISGVAGLFILVPITTYYLGPEEFGVAALLGSVLALVLPLGSTGGAWVLGAYFLSSDILQRREMLFNLLVLEGTSRVFLILALWLTADYLLPLFVEEISPPLFDFFAVLLLGSLANVFWPTMSYVMILEKRAAMFAGLELLRLVVVVGVTLFIAVSAHPKALLLYLPNAAASVVIAFVLVPIIVSRVRIRFSREWLLRSLRMGLPSLPGSYADSAVNSLDKIFIAWMIGVRDVGYYAHSRTYQAIFNLAGKALTQAVSPFLLEAYVKNGPLNEVTGMIRNWFLIMSLGGVALSMMIEDLIATITHGKFLEAAPLTIAWLLSSTFSIYGAPFTQYLIAQRRSVLIMKIQLSSLLMTLLFLALGVYFLGVTGAALGLTFGVLINQSMRRFFAIRIGCTLELGWVLVWVSVATIGSYLMTILWNIPLMLRLAIATVTSTLAIWLILKGWAGRPAKVRHAN